MATMTMLAAIRDTLGEEMARDERVVVLGEDVGHNGGVFRVTDGLLARFGASRVFDTPISESAIIGASVGLSVAGLVPVPEIQFAGFSPQAYHQLVGQLSRMRYRSRGRLHCPVTVRTPYGGGVRTPEHHADSVEAPYAHAPGIKIVVPSTAADAKGLLASAVRDPDPVLFFEPIPLYRHARDDVPEGEHLLEIGRAHVVREPSDAVVIAWGAMVPVACEAADVLAERRGAVVGVVDLRTLAPLDIETLVRVAERAGRVVVVHEAPLTAGFGAEVVATIQEEAFYSLEAPIRRVAGYDLPAPVPLVEDWCRPDAARVASALESSLDA
jgi:pyruvate dehydrogenase E1 component beta subunit